MPNLVFIGYVITKISAFIQTVNTIYKHNQEYTYILFYIHMQTFSAGYIL